MQNTKIEENLEYKVWCEWDMGWNLSDHDGEYEGKDLLETLENINWKQVGFDSWQDVEVQGFLHIDLFE